MPSYHPDLPQGHDLSCSDWPWQGGHHSHLHEVSVLDWGCYGGHWGLYQINVYILYAYKLFLKFSSEYINPNYFFFCFECCHRVCPNLSSAPCIDPWISLTAGGRGGCTAPKQRGQTSPPSQGGRGWGGQGKQLFSVLTGDSPLKV